MNNYVLVRTEHLNQYGHLYGGQMLSWIDDFCYIAVCRDFPDYDFVTRCIGQAEFANPVPLGAILRFHIKQEKTGNTSVTYKCQVSIVNKVPEPVRVFSTTVVFVAVDANGNKTKINRLPQAAEAHNGQEPR